MDCGAGVAAINTFVAGSSFSIAHTPTGTHDERWTMKKCCHQRASSPLLLLLLYWWMSRALAEYNKLLRILLSCSSSRCVLSRPSCVAVAYASLSFYDEWDWSWSRPFEGCENRYLHKVGQPALMRIVLGPSRLESWKIDSFLSIRIVNVVYLMKIYFEYSTANTAE